MRLRTISVLLLLAACQAPPPGGTPAPARPATLTYGPWAGRYVLVRHRHVEQVFQGQPLVTDVRSELWISLTTVTAERALQLELVVDSARVSGSGVPPGAAEGARGARFTAQLEPEGRIADIDRPTSANPLVDQLALDLAEFLPLLPRGGAKPEATWTDTTRNAGAMRDMTVAAESVNNRTATEWSAVEGGVGFEITTDARFTITGHGEQAGQPFTLSGDGRGRAQHWLGLGGRLLRLIRTDSTRIDVDLPGVGLVIPVTQQTVDTLRVLP